MNELVIQLASENDADYISTNDRHIPKSLIKGKINQNEIYILSVEGNHIGWMRYSYFWDNIPFMNMLWVDEQYRGKGYGKQTVLYWEEAMRVQGFNQVMTSTQSDEGAQHFYRKLGYKDTGCLILEEQPLEMIMLKKL